MINLTVVKHIHRATDNSYHRKIEACSRGQDLLPPPVYAQGHQIPAWISNHKQSEEVVQ